MNNYCIYSITNILNNKVYIGKTSADPSRRWKDHIRSSLNKDSKKQYIHRAILKYGIDNFKFSIIKYFTLEKDAYLAEKEHIKLYNSFGKNGYNETEGGTFSGNIRRLLSDDQVLLLINDYINTDMVCKDLVIKYKLCKPSVLSILNRSSYLDIFIDDEILYELWLKRNRNYYNEIDHVNCNFTKLSKESIINIFDDYVVNKISLVELAKKYNVTKSNLKFIINRDTWLDVNIDKNLLNEASLLLKKEKTFTSYKNKEYIKNNIYEDFKNGISKKDISKKYNIELWKVIKILNNSYWVKVPLKSSLEKFKQCKITRLTDSDVLNIIMKFCYENKSLKELAKIYNKSINNIRLILKRETFSHLKLNDKDNEILNRKIRRNITNN